MAAALRFCISFRVAMAFSTVFVVAGSMAAAVLAGEVIQVSQKNRAFSLNSITVSKGDVIQFTNNDEFIHQVYVDSPGFNVDTEEAPPGTTISVPFTMTGTFEVHCHIHPKMRLVVTVK